MAKTDLTAQRLRELLNYDADTGIFAWTSTGTGRRAAPGTMHNKGYLRITLDGRMYFAHRLAWLHVHGRWPFMQIDHINGIKTDNRLENLRDATPAMQQSNIRTNVWIEFGGRKQTASDWARELGMSSQQVITYRLSSGWSIEESLFNSRWKRPKKK